MSETRAAPSGINRDIQRKKDKKYPHEYEIQARAWIEAIIGRELKNQNPGKDGFADSLNDGTVLCEVMNKLLDHSGKKIFRFSNSAMAFHKMENISKFLKHAEDYGVSNSSLFQTVDLYEKQDVGSVVMCLFNLGGCVPADFPHQWGITVRPPTKREFSDETLAKGKTFMSKQAGYTGGASQAGLSAFGNTRKM